LGLTFCPGKQGDSVFGRPWQRDLGADLDVISRWGATAVVTLIEQHEFEMLGLPDLGQRVKAAGMGWFHLPIPDVQPPDARFELAWQRAGPILIRMLQSGARIVVHCRGGLRRAGELPDAARAAEQV